VFGLLELGQGSAQPRQVRTASAVRERTAFLATLANDRNDLEMSAISIAPAIADVLAALRASPGCRLARMSGSGGTCFGLFDSPSAAAAAAGMLRSSYPGWWVRATMLAA
jgi:4-diphosphocytidyl-2-C-methyl-D-erythritol kinase